VNSHRRAALFHSTEWLEALRRTYGFRAVVLTTSRPLEPLTNGLVFCRVHSWLTGRRLVSVPFSDHCVPLTEGEEEFECLLSRLQQEADQGRNKRLEIRSNATGCGMVPGLTVAGTFCLHQLDLHPTLDELFHAFHNDCIRRKIKRAERERLRYDDGTSEELLLRFYRLVVRTRRRQGIPPQPLSWFRNLISCIGDRAKLRVAFYKGEPVAGILTICHKSTMTYKYACSEPQFHKTGPMQLLIWKAIQEAKEKGLSEFDMGRTDWRNKGLLTFKDRWGCARATLVYLCNPAPRPPNFAEFVAGCVAKRVIASLPDSILPEVGSFLYRHFA
jgi:hypothetical protein